MRALLIAAAFAAMVLPATAGATTTTATTPFETDVAACGGGTIHLTGQLFGVFTANANPAGGFLFSSHVQPLGVRGRDQAGTTYIGTGLSLDLSVQTPAGGTTITLVNRFHLQATKGAQSFDVSVTVHITVLADGSVSALVERFSATC